MQIGFFSKNCKLVWVQEQKNKKFRRSAENINRKYIKKRLIRHRKIFKKSLMCIKVFDEIWSWLNLQNWNYYSKEKHWLGDILVKINKSISKCLTNWFSFSFLKFLDAMVQWCWNNLKYLRSEKLSLLRAFYCQF